MLDLIITYVTHRFDQLNCFLYKVICSDNSNLFCSTCQQEIENTFIILYDKCQLIFSLNEN